MVKGLDKFKAHFEGFEDRYVLIGGAACDLAFDEAGLEFRATKDLDLVLATEALDAEFMNRFWQFVDDGEYEFRQKGTGAKQLYRFQRPKVDGYPFMIELFSRLPESVSFDGDGRCTPLPGNEEASSLSALLMDNDYYELVRSGVTQIDGVPILALEYILVLKAKAWLDLTERKSNGQEVNGADIKKHKNDPFRIYQLLSPDLRVSLPDSIRHDLEKYFDSMLKEEVDLKNLGIRGSTIEDVLGQLRKIYKIT
jgi:hypothetical protein